MTKSDGLPPAVFLSLQAVSFVVACVDGVNKHVLSRLNKLDCDDALPSARGLAATLRPSSASKVPRKSPRCPAKLTGVECSVCLEHFEAEQPLFLLPCRHWVHQVRSWGCHRVVTRPCGLVGRCETQQCILAGVFGSVVQKPSEMPFLSSCGRLNNEQS